MSATFNPEINPNSGMIPRSPAIVTPPSVQLSSSDFISSYANYADVFEMPRQVHEWVAAQLIASALNGRVYIEWGATMLPLDLWVLLLSGSGQGRNTATDVAVNVIEEAQIGTLLRKATWGSRIAFFQQLAECPHGLYLWPELSVALKTLNDPKYGGVKEWITDRYDNLRTPHAIVYRITGKKADTPPIVFDQAPRINILATSSSDWFINNLEQADVAGGFIPRWLPKQLGKSDKVIPKPAAPNPELLPALGDLLASIASLKGAADLSQIEGQYRDWYREARERFHGQPNPGLAEPFFNRLRGQLLKLALIYEVSQSGILQVSNAAFQRAVAVASDAEETVFKLLLSGMTREGSELEKMAEKIRSAGPEGITRSELTRAFQHWKPRDREDRIRTLIDSGRVHEITRPTRGRRETRYVHDDYSAERQVESEASEQ